MEEGLYVPLAAALHPFWSPDHHQFLGKVFDTQVCLASAMQADLSSEYGSPNHKFLYHLPAGEVSALPTQTK